MPDTPSAIMDRFFGGYASGDIDSVAALFHPDSVIHETTALPFGGDYHGPDGFRRLLGAMLADFEFQALDPEYLPLGEDAIAVRMGARFTSRRSGAVVQFPVVEIYTMKDGLIHDVDVYYKDPSAVANLHDQPAGERSNRVRLAESGSGR